MLGQFRRRPLEVEQTVGIKMIMGRYFFPSNETFQGPFFPFPLFFFFFCQNGHLDAAEVIAVSASNSY